jgi:hypothetical protein
LIPQLIDRLVADIVRFCAFVGVEQMTNLFVDGSHGKLDAKGFDDACPEYARAGAGE